MTECQREIDPQNEILWVRAMLLLEKNIETAERGKWRGCMEMLCAVFSISQTSR